MIPPFEKAKKAKRESKYVEFKEVFDPSAREAWCEIIKDLVAIANTGGGVMLIGVDSRAEPVGTDVSQVLQLDAAEIADQIHRYTESHFSDFEVRPLRRSGATLAAIVIGASSVPLVFCRPGTYPVGKKQKTAFGQGTVYFRHGAKSEPGTSEDLRLALDRRLEEIRKEWIAGVRRVVRAPPGSVVRVLAQEVRESDSPDAVPIRVVDDPTAEAFRIVDPDKTHPYRQKELLKEIRKRLPPSEVVFNSFDLLSVRRVHGVEDAEEYCHHPKFGSPQYSPAMVDWIIQHYEQNPRFFQEARELYRSRSGG